jgi:hypothetical protein
MKQDSECVHIPEELGAKIGSKKAPAVMGLNNSVSDILADNKLPFFPNYTDHGLKHINRILCTITNHLIPTESLQRLSESDATALISASLLHDLAMHIREDGFLELIRGQTPHKPLPWFDSASALRQADLPWPQEWEEFRSRVQRFSDHDFFLTLGQLPKAGDLTHWIDNDLPNNHAKWTLTDYLLIGEFLRRHHGRLAHEISIFGFPGLSTNVFPALSATLPDVADIADVVARSHTLSLREAWKYLDYAYPKDIKPRGTAPLYLMALLRVADYLQIDSGRAPRILFKLRSPKIPPSIDAWNQHGAVSHISYIQDDPLAIKVELGSSHSLETHLQLKYLIEDLQKELDTTSAVLSEAYGRVLEAGICDYRLAKLRVLSNHNDQNLLDRLPYVPKAITFSADPKILSLMVEPIYGTFPEFGVRELLQNAVDAVLDSNSIF